MTGIRLAISAFIVLLIVVSVAGWMWTGANQPATQAMASRAVLGLGMIAGLTGLTAVWRWPVQR
jgi:membrane protein YdbS with pleckstrin-like domain